MPRTHKRSSKARRQRRPHDRILSFEAKGGFLDGARLDFVPGLNCIIGARGAGKTTVIELVRHILGLMPDPTISPARAKDLAKLIEANLGASGTAAVKVETKQGAGYAVQRSSHDVASVQDEQGAATAVRLVQDLIFQVEVYGKNEIEEIATTPALQLALLDKHADPDMRRVASEIRSVLRSLEENAHELLGLERATQELGDTTAEAVAIEVKLKEFQESGGADATKINAAHAEKALREKERRTTDSLGSVYRQIAADLESRALASARRLEVEIDEDVLGGRNKKLFAPIHEGARDVATFLTDFVATLKARTGRQVDALAQTGPRLAEVHAKQELVYRKLVADSEVERERARERAQVQQRHMEVAAAKKELGVRRKELFSCATRRQELMRKLVSLRDARFELRKKVAERLTQALDPEIRVAVRQAGNQDAYRKLLTEAFKQSGIRYPGFLESVVDGASPYDLAPLIQKGDAGHLAEHADIDRDRARRLVESLKGTEMLYKIEVADLDDLPRIELLEDGVYRDSGELSAGGRCTAILPIVLLESGGPLLVDQPEDNLDNKYMVDTIVKIVREAKLQRQLIFATHNPNIPVVGDAERVFILSSHRQRGRVEAVGTVEELKERIGNLLEGGKKAFLIRKERYGY